MVDESKLFRITCDNCGSEYRINSRGEMNCPFCGSKVYLNDKDFEEYLKTRDEMLVKDMAENDLVNDKGDVIHKWNNELQVFFDAKNGKSINCKYYYQYDRPDKTVYVGRERLSIVYNKDCIADVVRNISSLKYPSADIRGLIKYFPNIIFTTELKEGKHLLVLSKPENVYPLALVHSLDPKQVAWMISRMENIGCLLEFNHKDFTKLGTLDFYFNPKTHAMYLLDGWEYLIPANPQNYLTSIRIIAKGVMNTSTANKMCLNFLDDNPATDAYTDFNDWDDVIEHGFHGHNFHHFSEANY